MLTSMLFPPFCEGCFKKRNVHVHKVSWKKKMEQVFTLLKATQKVDFQIIHDGPLEFSFQNQNQRFFIRETSAN